MMITEIRCEKSFTDRKCFHMYYSFKLYSKYRKLVFFLIIFAHKSRAGRPPEIIKPFHFVSVQDDTRVWLGPSSTTIAIWGLDPAAGLLGWHSFCPIMFLLRCIRKSLTTDTGKCIVSTAAESPLLRTKNNDCNWVMPSPKDKAAKDNFRLDSTYYIVGQEGELIPKAFSSQEISPFLNLESVEYGGPESPKEISGPRHTEVHAKSSAATRISVAHGSGISLHWGLLFLNCEHRDDSTQPMPLSSWQSRRGNMT